jgi:hypothetical protein
VAVERHPLTDQVLVVLKRAWPGEVEKDDLIEQSGLSPTDLRDVLDQLRRDNELDENGENFAWRNPDDPERTGDPLPVEPGEIEEEPDESRLTLPDHTTGQVQVAFVVTASFAPERGQTDDSLRAKAGKIAEQMGNVLGTAMPTLGANAVVSKVQVFDKPRVVFDADTPAAEEEPDD